MRASRATIAWRDLPASFGPLQTRLEAEPAVQCGRHLGQGPGLVDRRGGRGRAGRLDGLGGLHDQPCPPARHHPGSDRATRWSSGRSVRGYPRRGLNRTTRSGPPTRDVSHSTTRWADLGAGSRPRSTSSSTAGGRPLVIALTVGQAGDSPMLKVLLADLAVDRLGAGRPRTRPAALLGDKAYSSAGNRELLRRKRVRTVIPQPSDQIAHRQRRGSTGGSSRG